VESHNKTFAEPHSEPVRRAPRKRVRPLLTFLLVVGLIVISAVIAGVLPRLRRGQALQAAVDIGREQKPIVNVTAVRRAAANTPLELPGDLQAIVESPIFARVDGYLSKRNVDIGDHVKAGQILAEIETPELEQQIQQMQATLSNSQSFLKELQAEMALAQANLNMSQKTYDRWQALEKRGAISHQDADDKGADLDVRKAQLEAARAKIASARDLIAANEANLRRLQQMKQFSHVTAPFDGIITYRVIDVGTLINSGNSGATHEIFRVADTSIMRIFVNVPQTFVGEIRDGQKAELRVQELPGQVFYPTVAHSTHEVDVNSRSMLSVLRVPNPTGILMPGMYAQVRFASIRSVPSLLIPGDALVSGSKGTRVAVVDAGSRIRFREIRVGIDYGGEIEVLSGVSAGDLVVMNPTDAVREGTLVEVHKSGN
jgi:RND family efflux transporter MFP subunit